jgi:hypothetical protein
MTPSASPERGEFHSPGLLTSGEQERQDSHERTRNAEESQSGTHRVPKSDVSSALE